MRFTKRQRHPFTDTPRKRAAVLVRQRKDRDRLPLFAEEIAATQKSVEEVMTARNGHWIRREIETRQAEAAKWREVRARIFALPDHERRLFLTYWNTHRWYPGNAGYLATVLYCYEVGRLVEHEGKLVDASRLEWERERDAKIRAMSDQDLDTMIQSHISMMFVEAGRVERRRRQSEQFAAA